MFLIIYEPYLVLGFRYHELPGNYQSPYYK